MTKFLAEAIISLSVVLVFVSDKTYFHLAQFYLGVLGYEA